MDAQSKAALLALALYLLSGLLNLLLRKYTPEALAQRAEKTHAGHVLAGALAHVGLNLPGLIVMVQRWLAMRAAQAQK